jgi:ABC-type branched-subunit amino acid transport system ATPase component
VLHGVDLAVAPGTITAILGANGAGKSSLCRAIAGLMATEGSVAFDGHDVSRASADARFRHGLLYAPESRGIFPGLSVEDNLRLTMASAAERAQAFERFPILRERRRLHAAMLSGGEQQMLAIAPLLVNPPRVLVIDEPTLGLAPLVVDNVLNLLLELRAGGTGILIAEEKPKTVLGMADQVALIELGRIFWQGPTSELTEELVSRAYHIDSSAEANAADARLTTVTGAPVAVPATNARQGDPS